VGLDLNLPVGTSLARAGCDPASAPDSAAAAWLAAAWLAAAGWPLRAGCCGSWHGMGIRRAVHRRLQCRPQDLTGAPPPLSDTAGYHPASGDGSQGFGTENFKALFEAIERSGPSAAARDPRVAIADPAPARGTLIRSRE